VSRNQILREVWNDEQGVSSNVEEVYIGLIYTIRGRDYRLNNDVLFLMSS
jgi:DNA-binding response OmpR family regulator